jgi:hypothetical protein
VLAPKGNSGWPAQPGPVPRTIDAGMTFAGHPWRTIAIPPKQMQKRVASVSEFTQSASAGLPALTPATGCGVRWESAGVAIAV